MGLVTIIAWVRFSDLFQVTAFYYNETLSF